MDFEKIKKLEDLKTKSAELGKKITAKWQVLKQNFAQKTKQEFKDYFTKKGFQVYLDNYSAKAIYGTYSVQITFSREDEGVVGSFDFYRLRIDTRDYQVFVNKIDGRVTSSSSARIVSNNENERLDQEIRELEETIALMEKKINDNTELKLGYMINRRSDEKEKYYEKLGDLIDSL